MGVEAVSAVKHHVGDWDKSIQFYRETLGLKLVFMIDNNWAQLEAPGGGRIGLVRSQDPNENNPPHAILSVSNLTELVDDLETHGVRLVGPIEETSYGRAAIVLDPSGNPLELIERLQR